MNDATARAGVPTIEVSHVTKSFGSTDAVVDVSFDVWPGEVFGLLGPNGAGKTTTIRMLLDIFQPDRGSATILGGPMNEAKKNLIGYMPEERGLYQDSPLERCLVYLGTIKGLSKTEARQRVAGWLERFDLANQRHKKVKELSKGMQQKAQIISTLLHEPSVIIWDEPFASLDPVNVQLVKDVVRELRDQGATILMSTHQMYLVEALCDRIVLINAGRDVLYGTVDEVRRRYAGHDVLVKTAGALPALPGVLSQVQQDGGIMLNLGAGCTPQDILDTLVAQRIPLEHFELRMPSLDEIFIRAVSER